MATELYFDTARLGRMCTEARKAERDFAKLASQLGSSLYFERFLAEGFRSLPSKLGDRLPGLHCWEGIAGLKRGLQQFVSLPDDGQVLLASQSSTLITLAAELLFRHCDSVLATDLEWPPYLVVLKRTANRFGKRLVVTPVRQRVLSGQLDRATLTQEIVDAYLHAGCDGLFLSHITHTTVRMPVRQILHSLPADYRPRFTVIDGAQALGHLPVRLDTPGIDLYLAGTQKWFGGYHPLRVGFVSASAASATDDDVTRVLRQLTRERRHHDPLHEFCDSIEARSLARFGETVNLTPLITAAGALAHWTASPARLTNAWHIRRQNLRQVLEAVSSCAPSAIHESLTSGAALLIVRACNRSRTRPGLRTQLARHRITASEPLTGFVRLAMPDIQLSAHATNQLRRTTNLLAAQSINGPSPNAVARAIGRLGYRQRQ